MHVLENRHFSILVGFILCMVMMAVLACAGQLYAEEMKKIAILKFESPGEPHLGAEIADILTRTLRQDGRFQVVSRNRIDRIASELAVTRTEIRDKAMVELGRIVGADWIVTGSVRGPLAEYSLIDTRTGRVVLKGRERTAQGLSKYALSIGDHIRHRLLETANSMPAPVQEDRVQAEKRLQQERLDEARRMAEIEKERMAKAAPVPIRDSQDKERVVQMPDRPERQPVLEKTTKDTMPPVITLTSPQVARGVKVVAQEESITVSGRATDESGVASVTVNDEKAGLDENGNFSADVLLKVGENRITITAMDTRKNLATESFTIHREAVKIAKARTQHVPSEKVRDGGVSDGRAFALIIGINTYQNLDRLKTAVSDARAVNDTLKEQYGFETFLILDEQASRANILNAINSLRKKLTEKDQLLIYYAGHGDFNPNTDTAYWLPVDAQRDMTTNWIEAKSISDQLKEISARHILIVADSCYSGTMTRKASTDLTAGSTREYYLQKLRQKPARVLIASGGNEPVADSGGKGHSVFADAFLQALRNPDRDVFTAEELHTNHIRESVAGRTPQTPEYKTIRNSGHEGGDFIFVRRKSSP